MNVLSMEVAARSWTEARFQILIGPFERMRRTGAKLGPYVLLELLLPGGTLFALLLFLYRRWKLKTGSLPTLIRLASRPEPVSMLWRGILAMQPARNGAERSWNAPLGIVRSDQARAQANSSGARAEVSIK